MWGTMVEWVLWHSRSMLPIFETSEQLIYKIHAVVIIIRAWYLKLRTMAPSFAVTAAL